MRARGFRVGAGPARDNSLSFSVSCLSPSYCSGSFVVVRGEEGWAESQTRLDGGEMGWGKGTWKQPPKFLLPFI